MTGRHGFSQPTTELPQILVQVTSAGEDPWLAVEQAGQCSTWASPSAIPANVKVVWIEGDPSESRRFKFRFANWAMSWYHTSFWWPLVRLNLRKIWPLGPLAWALNTILRRRKNPFRWPKVEFLDLTEVRRSQFRRSSSEPLIARFIRHTIHEAGSGAKGEEANRVRLPYPNSYFLAPARGILALRYILDTFEFDFLVRTVSTSYLELAMMSDHLKNLPRNRVYAGPKLELAGFEFVGGSLQVMSRDVVEAIVHYADDLRLDVYDDVGLGRLVMERSIAPVTQIDEVSLRDRLDTTGGVDLEELPRLWAFRCKVNRVTHESNPVIDVMMQLHEKLRK